MASAKGLRPKKSAACRRTSGRCARSEEEAVNDPPCDAQPSTAIASPAIRAPRQRATKPRRGRARRQETARSSPRPRGRKPSARNFRAPLRRHLAPRLPCRAALPAGPLSPCLTLGRSISPTVHSWSSPTNFIKSTDKATDQRHIWAGTRARRSWDRMPTCHRPSRLLPSRQRLL
jgi:hypothetical protein